MEEIHAGPVCKECNRAWRWPRNVSHMNLDLGQPAHIKPTTQSTVIAYLSTVPGNDPPTGSINQKAFENIEFTRSTKKCCKVRNRLVEEIEYHKKTGRVGYDVAKREPSELDDYAYARIVNLNLWYKQLFAALISVSLSVLDYYANFMLILSLFMADSNGQETELQKAVGNQRYAFTAGWLLMATIQLVWSAFAAYAEWHFLSHPKRGDLIVDCSAADRLHTFLALVFFLFFNIEESLRNITSRLHPWKSMQPFGAFKANGTRAYLLGYRSDVMFRVEERRGEFGRMLTQQLLNTLVLAFKVYICIWHQQLSLIASCFTSCPTILVGWYIWINLLRDRRVLRVRLGNAIRDYEQAMKSGSVTELQRREYEAAKAVQKAVFSTDLSFDTGFIVKNKPLCKRCGRDAVSVTSAPIVGTPKLEKGQHVMLSSDFHDFHDAKYGPLQVGQLGEVIDVGPDVFGIGPRYLVLTLPRGADACGHGETFWYDAGAISLASSTSRLEEVELPQQSAGASRSSEDLRELARSLHSALLTENLQDVKDLRELARSLHTALLTENSKDGEDLNGTVQTVKMSSTGGSQDPQKAEVDEDHSMHDMMSNTSFPDLPGVISPSEEEHPKCD